MTTQGFEKVLTFIEGSVSRDFGMKAKDALWSLLKGYEDAEVMAAARRFASGEDAKRGLPTAAHLVSLIDAERRYATRLESPGEPATNEEVRRFVAEMRESLKGRGHLRLVGGGAR
jgi:hypothetical protein